MRAFCAYLCRVLLDVLYPKRCSACDSLARAQPFCGLCSHSVETRSREPTAGVDLPDGIRQMDWIWEYGGAVQTAITRLKYGPAPWILRRLAPALVALDREYDVITHVPLHPRRRRSRGFDQAALLARHVARVQRVPLDFELLTRRRNTVPQASLDRRARLLNLRGAFEPSARATGARILLVDDVLTTGATLGECARMLLRAGAASVDGLALARAEPPA